MDLLTMQQALAASWDAQTAYRGATQSGNPAFGQCYPTARVVQQFLPDAEIVEGKVWTGSRLECHFWNVIEQHGILCHIDLTWAQFPAGSTVQAFRIRGRNTLADSEPTIERVRLLRARVDSYLAARRYSPKRRVDPPEPAASRL